VRLKGGRVNEKGLKWDMIMGIYEDADTDDYDEKWM
jgi:hypothetical protein